MSLFERRTRSGGERRNDPINPDRLWAARRKGTSALAHRVKFETALEDDGVWAALTLIAALGSTVPLAEIEERGDERVRVQLSPLFMDPDPDPSIDAEVFRYQCLMSAASSGNAYAEMIGGKFGSPTGMTTIEEDRVEWKRDDSTGAWMAYVDGVARERWPLGSLWHWPLNVRAGRPFGLNPIEYQRETIARALGARDWGSSYFAHGPLPLMMFTNEGTKDPGVTGAQRLKSRIMEALDGSRDPVLLPRGIKGEQVRINANESQFLETQRMSIEQVARIFFGGFPEMIGGSSSGSAVTYANLEQKVSAFTSLALIPKYLRPFEKALSRLAPSGHVLRHKVDAIVRADLAARYASYMQSAQVFRLTGQPILTSDEIRALEDRESLDPDEYPTLRPAAPAAPNQTTPTS